MLEQPQSIHCDYLYILYLAVAPPIIFNTDGIFIYPQRVYLSEDEKSFHSTETTLGIHQVHQPNLAQGSILKVYTFMRLSFPSGPSHTSASNPVEI